MARFKITLEYEGTRYSGWQIQKNARTVQGELVAAARTAFCTAELDLQGSGRTDAGVHALMQTAHLDVQTMLAPEIIRMKLNDALPADINILEVEKAHPAFHARHDATARTYLYQISRRRTALGKRFVWWVKDPLDIARMRAVGPLFEGMKDFRSFTADDPDEKSTKVHLDAVRVEEAGALILVRVTGSHFIWKMVRQMVGVMVEAGKGVLSPEQVRGMIERPSELPARLTAPPSGLFLERVHYGAERVEVAIPVMNIGLPPRVPRRVTSGASPSSFAARRTGRHAPKRRGG